MIEEARIDLGEPPPPCSITGSKGFRRSCSNQTERGSSWLAFSFASGSHRVPSYETKGFAPIRNEPSERFHCAAASTSSPSKK